MDKTAIQQLTETTKHLITNLIIRIDSILKEFEEMQAQDLFSNERIIFMLDDFMDLTDAIAIIQNENSGIYLEELTEKLGILYNNFELKDRFLFKDIIQFEIKPLLEHWTDII